MIQITQYFLKHGFPYWNSLLTRMLYGGSRVKIGRNFRADGIPRILVDKNCQITIGNNVDFRQNVEIRAHGQSHIYIGDNVRIDRGVRILAANNARIDVKSQVRIGLYSVFNGGDSITVGAKSLISGFVYLQTSMHGYSNKALAVQDQGYNHSPVTIGDDAWLGTHVVVLPGVNIGDGGVVGSNAVVTKNIEPYQVVAGIPAEPLKNRS